LPLKVLGKSLLKIDAYPKLLSYLDLDGRTKISVMICEMFIEKRIKLISVGEAGILLSFTKVLFTKEGMKHYEMENELQCYIFY